MAAAVMTPQALPSSPGASPRAVLPARGGRAGKTPKKHREEACRMLTVCVRLPDAPPRQVALTVGEGEGVAQVVARVCAHLHEDGVELIRADPVPYTLRLANPLGRFVRGCPPFDPKLPLAEQLSPPCHVVFLEDPAFHRAQRRMREALEEQQRQADVEALHEKREHTESDRAAEREARKAADLVRCQEYELTRVENEEAVRVAEKKAAAARLGVKLQALQAAKDARQQQEAAAAAATAAQQRLEVAAVLDLIDAAIGGRAAVVEAEAEARAEMAARGRDEGAALRSTAWQREHLSAVKAALTESLDASIERQMRLIDEKRAKEAAAQSRLEAFRATTAAQREKTRRFVEMQQALAFVAEHEAKNMRRPVE
eukprot:TRINITY_DN30392_c0_g1_i1.p1 TRINITY_DN30392_c0_g1~~TRINITY_DN30392_c0_g1_i1.p1  ORF type:complete len:371 (+),score=124.58 TRINITY_DN30392_c0_g1_i1:98-1210(+)